ncbi:hypothetical protein Mapa_003672 [Marchantia paleacea]|nr:hypothetical protein Mapa_003672 [Marchantia paleacea]
MRSKTARIGLLPMPAYSTGDEDNYCRSAYKCEEAPDSIRVKRKKKVLGSLFPCTNNC